MLIVAGVRGNTDAQALWGVKGGKCHVPSDTQSQHRCRYHRKLDVRDAPRKWEFPGIAKSSTRTSRRLDFTLQRPNEGCGDNCGPPSLEGRPAVPPPEKKAALIPATTDSKADDLNAYTRTRKSEVRCSGG